MPQTYSIAITDGGYMPIDIKTNLTFKEALKETLSHLEEQDITQICSLYAISTKNHKVALNRIQDIIKNISKKITNFTMITPIMTTPLSVSIQTLKTNHSTTFILKLWVIISLPLLNKKNYH